MYISSEQNSYPFSNTTLSIIDNTTVVSAAAVQKTKPRHNYLFPVKLPKGPTNEIIQFYPGEYNLFASTFGTPSYSKNGVASELIHKILSMPASGMGVYVINLKDTTATKAYAVLCATIESTPNSTQKTNSTGVLLYLTADGREVTESEGNTPIMLDVVTVKFEVKSPVDELSQAIKCKSETEVFSAMETLYKVTTEETKTTTVYPLMAFFYAGNGTYGNNISLRFDSIKSEYSSTVNYKLTVQDGSDGSTATYSANLSFFYDAEQYFVGNVINSVVPNINTIASNYIEEFFTSVKTTIGSLTLKSADIFDMDFTVDKTVGNSIDFHTTSDSLDIGAHEAIKLSGGLDVVSATAEPEKTFDEMAVSFFKGELVQDINSLLRYRINQIIDVNYSEDVKAEIVNFCNTRIRATNATLCVGSTTNFSSAIVDSNENYVGKSFNTRLLTKCQSAMAVSEYTKRLHVYPPTYFDTAAFIKNAIENGNIYTPFAGAKARWLNYKEGSIMYPAESSNLFTELNNARLNVVKKDSNTGAYLSDQILTTTNVSDLTEFSNALILADMIYDVVELVHQNNWSFNESDEVKAFKEKVDKDINALYSAYAAVLSVEVYRVGETGLEGRTNAIEISVDFKDISKFARVSFIIDDLGGAN